MEVNIDNVERALTQFYHTNSRLQAEAHQWLTAIQASHEAWSFVWHLLQPNRSCEAQFFGATTLHTKLMKNWYEVPQDQYEILKTKILESIVEYSSGPKIVLNRLCIALATYIIRTTPRDWPNSLEDILLIFRPENLPNVPADRVVWILLEILTVIPEEWNTMLVNSAHRTSVLNELERVTPKVMTLLENLLDSTSSGAGGSSSGELRSQAVKALSAWLNIGAYSLPNCLTLIQKLVNIVRNQSTDATESCENELDALTLMLSSPHQQYHPRAVLQAIEMILQLHPLAVQSENQDFVINVYRVLVGAGEAHCHLLLTCYSANEDWQASLASNLIRSILACTSVRGAYPIDETHSALTFPFWYSLQDELMTLNETEMRAASPHVVPIYEELCRVFLYKSQLPADDNGLSATEAELLRIYRQDIADTIVCCYFITRHYLISLLTSSMANAKTWQEVEAVLHVIIALAETTWNCEEGADDSVGGGNVGRDESGGNENGKLILGGGVGGDMMAGENERQAILSLLLTVPRDALENKHVMNGLNQAIGAYAEWWVCHMEILGQLIPTMVSSFLNPVTATSATMALKDVTRECTACIAPFAPQLLASCQEALSKGHLQQTELVRIMYSVGRLLSILPYDELLNRLDPIVQDHTNCIAQALNEPVTPDATNTILLRLRLLGTLCSSVYLNENVKAAPPTLFIVERLLPAISAVTTRLPQENLVTTEVARCLKSAVINMVPSAIRTVLPAICDLAAAGYNSNPNTATLDLAKQMFVLLRQDNGLVVKLLQSISRRTMALASSAEQASESGEVLQGYFHLEAAIAKKSLQLLPLSVDLKVLFDLAIASLTLPETGTVKAAGSMLCSILSNSRDHPALPHIVQCHGEALVETVLKCIGGDTLRSNLDVFADILLMLNKKYCDNLARWLNQLLSRTGFPTDRASDSAKASFTKSVLRERANRRKLIDTVGEFALVCRGLVNPDYTPTAQSHQ